jgi:hypothetical protein
MVVVAVNKLMVVYMVFEIVQMTLEETDCNLSGVGKLGRGRKLVGWRWHSPPAQMLQQLKCYSWIVFVDIEDLVVYIQWDWHLVYIVLDNTCRVTTAQKINIVNIGYGRALHKKGPLMETRPLESFKPVWKLVFCFKRPT